MKTKSPTKTNINNLTRAASASPDEQALGRSAARVCIFREGIVMRNRQDPVSAAWEKYDRKRRERDTNFFRFMVLIGCGIIAICYWSYTDKKNEVLYKNTVEQRLASNAANGNYGPGFGGAR